MQLPRTKEVEGDVGGDEAKTGSEGGKLTLMSRVEEEGSVGRDESRAGGKSYGCLSKEGRGRRVKGRKCRKRRKLSGWKELRLPE